MNTETVQPSKRIGSEVSIESPRFSVVIPAYCVAAYLATTLESVFAQSVSDFEVIVVNDGSPDTPELESALGPFIEKIIYIIQPNAGASSARNTAIENARGKFIAFLDGDDIWRPDYLASQAKCLVDGNFDMVYCDAELFGVPAVTGKTFMQQSPSTGTVDVSGLLDLRCNVITSGTVARKSAIETAGMFESERIQGEDFSLWVRMAHTGAAIGFQKIVLLKYRVSPTGFSGDSINRVERAIDVFKRLDKRLELTAEHKAIVERRISGFETDLAIERGKAYLLAGSFSEARAEFAEANRRRPSAKLAAVSILSRLAPKMLLRLWRSRNAGQIAFVPKLSLAEVNVKKIC